MDRVIIMEPILTVTARKIPTVYKVVVIF